MSDEPGSGASLHAYLEIAQTYFAEDRLDMAMKVAQDAFSSVGWPAGLWTAFYNELICEKEARNASELHRVDDSLSIELRREEDEETRRTLVDHAVKARAEIYQALSPEESRSVMITVFLPDAAVDFIVGSHGYVSRKVDFDKICVPYDTLESSKEMLDTLLHEFAHVASYDLVGDDLPAWMDEGLATFLCGDLLRPECPPMVEMGVTKGRLLSLSRLEGAFTDADLYKDDPELVEAAYYLAATMVSFWVERSGLGSVRDALIRIGDGEGVRRSISRATGVSLWQLERAWRRSVRASIGGSRGPSAG